MNHNEKPWGLRAAESIVRSYRDKERAEYLLGLYSQLSERLLTAMEGWLPALQMVANGDSPMDELDAVIEEIEVILAGRQAIDTWGDSFDYGG